MSRPNSRLPSPSPSSSPSPPSPPSQTPSPPSPPSPSTSSIFSAPLTSLSPTPSSPPPSPSQSGQDTRTAIIVTVTIVVLTLCLGLGGYFIYRWRSRRQQDENRDYEGELSLPRPSRSRKPAAVDRSHVAARITPYGSSTNLVPHYDHAPGIDMRIATRRPDGAWEFSNPGTPFNPSGVDDLEPPASLYISTPTPSRSTFNLDPSTPTPTRSTFHGLGRPITPPSIAPSISDLSSFPPSIPNTPLSTMSFASSMNLIPSASGSSSASRSEYTERGRTSTSSLPEPPKSPAQLMKERESKAARLIRKGYDDREFSDEPPPPAYGQDTYLDHTSQPEFR